MALKRKKSSFDIETPKIILGKNDSRGESFYRLKDNVIYYSDNGKNKIFQIESAIAGEGKSTVSINLAVALAKSGKKVCVIDLDFRRPKIHRAFNIPNFNGIAEFMLGECTKEQLIKKTDYNVDIINRGKSAQNASIIFTSDKFKALVAELRDVYDIILFDCPPVLLLSDYIHISKLSDAVLFVVAGGITRRSQFKEAIELLNRNKVNIFGVVLTFRNIKKFSIKYGGYYGGKYYRGASNYSAEE